jgi:prepilin-type N-terminal cleavage/methylation domain-containing protein
MLLLKKAFTLIELMIVIVIVGVLATLAIVQLSGPKEQAFEKEARVNLKLIAAAEKIYRMEVGQYIDVANEAAINDILRVMLPTDAATKNWNYTVTTSADGTQFIANATRTKGSDIRTYSVTQASE